MSNHYYILPEPILQHPDLSDKAKLLWPVINTLSYKEGYFWGSNQFLQDKLMCSERSIRYALFELKSHNLISIKEGSGKNREIYPINPAIFCRVEETTRQNPASTRQEIAGLPGNFLHPSIKESIIERNKEEEKDNHLLKDLLKNSKDPYTQKVLRWADEITSPPEEFRKLMLELGTSKVMIQAGTDGACLI